MGSLATGGAGGEAVMTGEGMGGVLISLAARQSAGTRRAPRTFERGGFQRAAAGRDGRSCVRGGISPRVKRECARAFAGPTRRRFTRVMPAHTYSPLFVHRFPEKFVWGVATAAPQIEGAAFADGKSASTWDAFCRVPGKVLNGDTLDVACDHYNRYEEDFDLMVKLGVKHYRLSLAWPRICPDGDGRVNQAGLDFYHRVLDALAARGITPWVTMYHWDLPDVLEQRGGWRSRDVVDAFALYADVIVKAFADKVKNWITLNEISCFTRMAYGTGRKAPGLREPEQVVNQTYHHALLCHGHGVRAVREHARVGARVGLTDNPTIPVPVSMDEADVRAAELAFLDDNIRVLDPLYRGGYSERYHAITGADAARVQPGDFNLISQPTDFLGLNVYWGYFVRAGRSQLGTLEQPFERLPMPSCYPRTSSPWHALVPQALHWGPRFVHGLYGAKPLYITEHGAGYDDDVPDANGEILDLHRRDCLRTYLREMLDAIEAGVPIAGYFLWSFLDNFEWQDGYVRRFGVVHNDFVTQKRTPKFSAHWYRQVMAANALQ